MSKQKKQTFKLNPEWMFKKPIDFEFNKYTLLDYLQKCEKNFNNLEVYPDFVELSLHIANIQSVSKENKLLMTNKIFESCDDEILIKDLVPKKTRQLDELEVSELEKTITYSGGKLFEAFNTAKNIWNLAYENIDVSLKKNKVNLFLGKGYFFHFRKQNNQIYTWEYEIKKSENEQFSNKTQINLICQCEPLENTLLNIIKDYSTWKEDES